MKFSIKKNKTLALVITDKKTLQKEIITVKGDYGVELLFTEHFPLEGVYREKMDRDASIRWAKQDMDQLILERDQLREKVKKLKAENRIAR